MSIIVKTVKTSNPTKLLADIKSAIDNNEIRVWTYKGNLFTHNSEQYLEQAWLRSYVDENQPNILTFGIVETYTAMTKEIYGVYHGRFIQMLLTHFDTKFFEVYATAYETEYDIF